VIEGTERWEIPFPRTGSVLNTQPQYIRLLAGWGLAGDSAFADMARSASKPFSKGGAHDRKLTTTLLREVG